jgi:hypothetical protein
MADAQPGALPGAAPEDAALPMEALAGGLFAPEDDPEWLRDALTGIVDLFKADRFALPSLLLEAEALREPWARGWRKLSQYVVQLQGSSARLVERLVELADVADELDVRQLALDALCCLPPCARVLAEALRTSQLEALLRKLLQELQEQPSPRTRARQQCALRLAALLAVHAGDKPGGAPLVLLCVHRCCEALRLAAQRGDLLPVALWALAALGERQWPRLEGAGVVKVRGQRWLWYTAGGGAAAGLSPGPAPAWPAQWLVPAASTCRLPGSVC